jgi:hypothetical protein
VTVEIQMLVTVFDREAQLLDSTLRDHPSLRPLFARERTDARAAYLALLKLTADYVQHTVPALRAAGELLRTGDDTDRAWSEHFLAYAAGETDDREAYGHHIWALADMRALAASASLLDAPPHPVATLYGRFFVDEVRQHPYAILGAKGVLEHLSIRCSDDLVAGVVGSGIPGAADAVTFFRHHGVLDIDHVREGDRNLERLPAAKRPQVLHGAYFTSGIYRTLVDLALP